jgi:hypothetical protein
MLRLLCGDPRNSIFRAGTATRRPRSGITIPPLPMLRYRSRDRKSLEKKITIIAQEAIEANHAKKKRGVPIATPDSLALTLRTSFPDHCQRPLALSLRGTCLSLSKSPRVLMRTRNKSISRPIRSEISPRCSSRTFSLLK